MSRGLVGFLVGMSGITSLICAGQLVGSTIGFSLPGLHGPRLLSPIAIGLGLLGGIFASLGMFGSFSTAVFRTRLTAVGLTLTAASLLETARVGQSVTACIVWAGIYAIAAAWWWKVGRIEGWDSQGRSTAVRAEK